MEPEGIAIRLEPLRVASKELEGTTPVVVFAEQGQAGAGLKDLATPPGRFRGPNHAFQIKDIILVVDCSSSMADPVLSGNSPSKMDQLKADLTKLQAEYPGSRVSLVRFDNRASEVPLSDPSSFKSLLAGIANLTAQGGTNFQPALEVTDNILGQNSSEPDARNVVIFATDGHDAGSRNRAHELAAAIRDKNTFTFLVGVGADYHLGNIVTLAGKFGFSGWAHIPTPEGRNVFSTLLPALLDDLRGADHYMRVEAAGGVRKFYGLTPSIRPVDDHNLRIGYQNRGIGVCFADGRELQLTLAVGEHVGDRNQSRKPINILDAAEAAAHFERLSLARDSIAPLLVLQAQLDRDLALLRKLHDAYPEIQREIAGLIQSFDGESLQDRQDSLSLSGDLGSMTGFSTFFGSRRGGAEQVNALSQVHPPARGNRRGGNAPHPFSGGVGPLSQGFQEPPDLGRPNPAAYESLPGQGVQLLRFNTGGGPRAAALDIMKLHGVQTIGSSRDADILIEAPGVAGKHLQIRREIDGYYAVKLGWLNRVQLNGKPMKGEVKLNHGDRIQLGSVELTFE